MPEDNLDPVVSYLRESPHASRQQVMKALSVSARVVRQGEEQLAEQDRGAAKRRRFLTLMAFALIALSTAAYYAYDHWRDVQEEERQAALVTKEQRVEDQERGIYKALGSRNADRADEIAEHLQSDEERLRLAALRYLATIDPKPHKPALLALVEDSSSRVRLAAIQMVGRIEGKAVEDKLVAVILDEKREQAERMLAIATLRERRSLSAVHLARSILPAVLANSAVISGEVEELLSQLTEERIVEVTDKAARHARWAKILEAASK